MKNENITQEYLKQILDYNPETGIFTRVISKSSNAKAGNVAGYLSPDGYIYIGINAKRYKSHRLAWLYVYGEMPSKCIDHINCNKTNNKINNLRLSTHSQNKMNTPKQKNNTSGFKGVTWHKELKKWMVAARLNKKRHYLGYFSDIKEAAKAYANFAKKNHGEFFREC
jgi:hypothetical protein